MRGVARTARERGAALILVLWTFAALTALAGEFARAMREDAQSTKNFKEETISHYVAIAAINEALLAIETYNGQIPVDADDRALWRRIVCIPFDHVVPEGRRDKAVKVMEDLHENTIR